MSNNLKEKKCFKYLKLPDFPKNKIINYINYKIRCDGDNGARKVPLNNGVLVNAEKLFRYDFNSYKIQNKTIDLTKLNYHPSIVKDTQRQKFNESLFTSKLNVDHEFKNDCALCELHHTNGFKSDYVEKILFGNIVPTENETLLIWRDYYIVNNLGPKDAYNMMLIKSNHINKKIKGSQYEIINLETISDTNDFISSLKDKFRFGQNYASTGSQTHYHIQIIKNQINGKYGLDKLVEDMGEYIIDEILEEYENDNSKKEGNFTMKKYFTEENIFNPPDPHTKMETFWKLSESRTIISLTKFYNNIYGYKGLVLQTSNYDLAKDDFNLILKNILNYIENSSKYSFTLYFPTTNSQPFSVIIFPQIKGDTISFYQLMGNIHFDFTDNSTKDSDTVFNYLKMLKEIYKNVDFSFLNDNILKSLIQPKIILENSLYSNTNVRNLFNFRKYQYRTRSYTNLYFNEKIKGKIKSTFSELKIIIINSPIGMGKTSLFDNLKNYFNFYDEEKFIHINIDDIIHKIPEYYDVIKKIRKYLLKNVLNKKLSDLDNSLTNDLKVKDLKESDNMMSLSIQDYKKLFNKINNIKIKETNGKYIKDLNGESIQTIADEIFRGYVNTRDNLYDNICKFCERNKFNIVIETANLPFEYISDYFENFNENYKIENRYLLSYSFDSELDEMKKFSYRNVLLRSIFQGRVLSFDFIKKRFSEWNDAYNSYTKNIYSQNIKRVNLDFKFKLDFNNYKINPQDIVKAIVEYIEKYKSDIKCIDMGNYVHWDPDRIKIKEENMTTIDLNSKKKYSVFCVKNRKLKYKEEIYDMKYKNICTDYITKFLLNESNNTYIINNTISIFDDIIVNLLNESPEMKASNIDKNDFKIVFKGGMNTSFFIKSFNKIIMNKLNLNNKNNTYQKIRKKFNIIENKTIFDDDKINNIDRDISSIAKKSDLDFTVLINKSKFKSENNYNYCKDYIIKMLNIYLWKLRMKLDSTNFLYTNNIINIKELEDFCLDNGINKINLVINSADFKVVNRNKDEILTIIPNRTDFTDNEEHPYGFGNPKAYKINYYTIYDFNLPKRFLFKDGIITYTDEKIDILRLKANFRITKKFLSRSDATFDTRGEILDITIDNYNNKDEIDKFKKIKKIKYSGLLNEFTFNVFNIDYLIYDLRKMLIGRYFPWLDKKYTKRLHRYFYLITMTMFIFEDKSPSVNQYTKFKYKALKKAKDELEKYCEIKLSNPTRLLDYMEKSNIKFEGNINHHVEECLKDFDDFKKNLNELYKYYSEFYKQLKNIQNKEIVDEIYKKLYSENEENELKLNLWGGSNYKKLKIKYLKKKKLFENKIKIDSSLSKLHKLNKTGGAIDFKDQVTGINFPPGSVSQFRSGKNPVYEQDQYEFLKSFFTDWIKKFYINNKNFTDNDIQNSKAMGCGAFGCAVLVPHEQSGKKYIFKIIEDGDGKQEIEETYLGYYITQNKFKVSNKIIGYINSNRYLNNYSHFSSIIPNIKFDYDQIVPYNLLNTDLFIIILEAGNDSLLKLSDHMLNNYKFIGENYDDEDKNIAKIEEIEKIKKLDSQISRIICQSFDISSFIKCHEIADKCVFFLHLDIKPENFIFLYDNVKDEYDIQVIDYGVSMMKNYFYSREKHPADPNIPKAILNKSSYDLKLLSPFFDLSSTMLSIILSITKEPKEKFRWNNDLAILIRNSLNTNLTSLYKLKKIKKLIYEKLVEIYTDNDYSLNNNLLLTTEKLLYCYNIMLNISNLQRIAEDNIQKLNFENSGVTKKRMLGGKIIYSQLNINNIQNLNPEYTFTEIEIEGDDYDIYRKIIQISKNLFNYDKYIN